MGLIKKDPPLQCSEKAGKISMLVGLKQKEGNVCLSGRDSTLQECQGMC